MKAPNFFLLSVGVLRKYLIKINEAIKVVNAYPFQEQSLTLSGNRGRSGKFALLESALYFSNSLRDGRGAHPYTPRYPRQRIPYSPVLVITKNRLPFDSSNHHLMKRFWSV
jgi:hypothetical protein